MSNVSPRLEAAAASTRDESELRALLRAKLETQDAYEAHRRRNDLRQAGTLTLDERIDHEAESHRLWNLHWAACLAVTEYTMKKQKVAA